MTSCSTCGGTGEEFVDDPEGGFTGRECRDCHGTGQGSIWEDEEEE